MQMNTKKTKIYFDHLSGERKVFPNQKLDRKSQFNIQQTHCYFENCSLPISVSIDLLHFKKRPCRLETPHQPSLCSDYHNQLDQIRENVGVQACPNLMASRPCQQGQNCGKCHNNYQLLYRPVHFRVKMCGQGTACKQKFCIFAHSQSQLKIDLLHKYQRDQDFYLFYFKTMFCPFIDSHPHAKCVYAHSWNDYRRSPAVYNYSSQACPIWKGNVADVARSCPKGLQCEKSHGWLQQRYHPALSRYQQSKQMQVFNVVPKNRLTKKTMGILKSQPQQFWTKGDHYFSQEQDQEYNQ